MASYGEVAMLDDIRAAMFPYTSQMYPYEFLNYYYYLPVETPGGDRIDVGASRYISGLGGSRIAARAGWRGKIKPWFDKKGWPAGLQDWMKLGRDGSVFAGHGLPEEISMVCALALATGHKTQAQLGPWAKEMLGIDCNGFVCAYLTSLGLFSRPCYTHPQYPVITPAAKTTSEIGCDSVIVTAEVLSEEKGTKIVEGKVRQNPGNDAHIMVIDMWYEHGKSFWASDQPNPKHPGPRTVIYHIEKAPPAAAKKKSQYVWTIRMEGKTEKQPVYITRPMESW